MGIFQKGQGATEYLVLLAVVLIIALVSIALLGFFPGLATDARIAQSNSYWRGEARPFAILEHSVTATTGTATLVIQNYEASGTLTITNLQIGSNASTTTTPLAPGEVKTMTVIGAISGSPTSGTVYDSNVTITYNTSNGIVAKQYGAKNIIGKVS